MHYSIGLHANDLTTAAVRNRSTSGGWQIQLGTDRACSLAAYVTAEEAQHIAETWAALAADLAEREADERDDERAATVAALSPDAEAVLARAFGNDPRPPRPVGELAREFVDDIDALADQREVQYREQQAAAYGAFFAGLDPQPEVA